jgi:hypothetical protein
MRAFLAYALEREPRSRRFLDEVRTTAAPRPGTGVDVATDARAAAASAADDTEGDR